MPKMSVAVSHALDESEALDRLKRFLATVKEQYSGQINDLVEEWGDTGGSFSFKAMGFKVGGTVAVAESEVRIDGNLPLAAVVFKGRIEETIRQQLDRVLA